MAEEEKLGGYQAKKKSPLQENKKGGITRRGQSVFGEGGIVHKTWVKKY